MKKPSFPLSPLVLFALLAPLGGCSDDPQAPMYVGGVGGTASGAGGTINTGVGAGGATTDSTLAGTSLTGGATATGGAVGAGTGGMTTVGTGTATTAGAGTVGVNTGGMVNSGTGGAGTAGTGMLGVGAGGVMLTGGAGGTTAIGGAGMGMGGMAMMGDAGASAMAGSSAGGADSEIPATLATLELVIMSLGCNGSDCHGGNEFNPLDLRINEELYVNLTSSVSMKCGNLPVIDPGNPEGSALVRLIKGPCGEIGQMPAGCVPGEGGGCVPDDYIAAIEQWVLDGAPQ